jgi:glycosyltransferase involved in cell wall biosynthesis
MRIAHVTATFPPHWTGTGLVCFHNACQLAQLGHEVHVYTTSLPDTPEFETLQGVQIHRLKPLFQIGNAPLLAGLMDLRDFDLIHLHYPFISGAELVWLVSRMRGIPYVLTHHNDLIGNGLRKYLFDFYTLLTAGWVVKGASRWLAVSKDHATSTRFVCFFNQRPECLLEVSNGVDVKVFQDNHEAGLILKEVGIPPGRKVILFVGGLDRAHHFKGIETLLKAFAEIRHNDSVLLFVGDGDLKDHYMEQSAALEISEEVFFMGTIPHSDLPPYISSADVLVLPSEPPESFGMVLIEAMACGKPVIASNLPGVRTVVEDGVDGYLVQPGSVKDLAEKLAKMLALPEAERRAMGAAGRRKVLARYTWESIGERLEQIYIDTLSAAPARVRPVREGRA